jgi:hypothetical protein
MQDPEGSKLMSFRVYDEDDHDDLVAHGEIDDVQVTIKYAQQTEEGDKDVVRVSLFLDCNV